MSSVILYITNEQLNLITYEGPAYDIQIKKMLKYGLLKTSNFRRCLIERDFEKKRTRNIVYSGIFVIKLITKTCGHLLCIESRKCA